MSNRNINTGFDISAVILAVEAGLSRNDWQLPYNGDLYCACALLSWCRQWCLTSCRQRRPASADFFEMIVTV